MVVVRAGVGEAASAAVALRGRVVTVGNFDGVHRGHRHLVDATARRAASLGTEAAVITFDPAPRDVLRPDNGIPRIQSLARRLHHLGAAGAGGALVVAFDAATAAMEPEDFARALLRDALDVRGVVVGHDFRFGRRRRGDVALLRSVLDAPVDEVDALADGGGPISSSRVRALLAQGDVAAAAGLLGRPHEVCGPVVTGDRRGRTLGFPTANVVPDCGLLPPDGVYAVEVDEVDAGGRLYGGVANLGVRPTFGGGSQRRLEVHLFDFAGDLYGRRLVVRLVERLRGEQRFSGVDALVAQIRLDAAAARARLAAR